jgi:hypothetical protein
MPYVPYTTLIRSIYITVDSGSGCYEPVLYKINGLNILHILQVSIPT